MNSLVLANTALSELFPPENCSVESSCTFLLCDGIPGLLMDPVVYFGSESLFYLMGAVVHSRQTVQRSHPDKAPNDKSLRHIGAVSDRVFS